MSGQDDGTIPFKRLGEQTVLAHDVFVKQEAELAQLRFEVKWLREANKGLSEELKEVRARLLAFEAIS